MFKHIKTDRDVNLRMELFNWELEYWMEYVTQYATDEITLTLEENQEELINAKEAIMNIHYQKELFIDEFCERLI